MGCGVCGLVLVFFFSKKKKKKKREKVVVVGRCMGKLLLDFRLDLLGRKTKSEGEKGVNKSKEIFFAFVNRW